MKLSARNRKLQKSILDCLARQIPVASILASTALMAGCNPKEPRPGTVMGKMILGEKDGTNTTETVPDCPVTPGEPPVPTNSVPPSPAGLPPVEDTMGELMPIDGDIDAADAEPQTADKTTPTEENK